MCRPLSVVLFVCLSEMFRQKTLKGFLQNMVEGWDSGQERTSRFSKWDRVFFDTFIDSSENNSWISMNQCTRLHIHHKSNMSEVKYQCFPPQLKVWTHICRVLIFSLLLFEDSDQDFTQTDSSSCFLYSLVFVSLAQHPKAPFFQPNVAALSLSHKKGHKGVFFSYISQGDEFSSSHSVSNEGTEHIIRAPLCLWQVLERVLMRLAAQQ